MFNLFEIFDEPMTLISRDLFCEKERRIRRACEVSVLFILRPSIVVNFIHGYERGSIKSAGCRFATCNVTQFKQTRDVCRYVHAHASRPTILSILSAELSQKDLTALGTSLGGG